MIESFAIKSQFQQCLTSMISYTQNIVTIFPRGVGRERQLIPTYPILYYKALIFKSQAIFNRHNRVQIELGSYKIFASCLILNYSCLPVRLHTH